QLPVVGPDVTQAVNGVQKKFLVFDQSGDQTTLIYSSGVGTAPARYQYPSLNNNPKPQYGSYPVHVDETIKEDNGNDSSSEMREDTEELNALLYSDDDDDDEENEYNCENEETSTGHSPSSMIRFGEQKLENVIGEEEEVASSGGPTKRRKLEDDGNIITSLEDTASSGKSGIYCSGNDGNGVFEEEFSSFSCGNKRPRIEKMKETINLIQNLIPGDKSGKNAIMVIDEAIQYLRDLKVKAKALGLDSLSRICGKVGTPS
nr:transcription factor bHLH145-like [Tanacetum cinerariifolium]